MKRLVLLLAATLVVGAAFLIRLISQSPETTNRPVSRGQKPTESPEPTSAAPAAIPNSPGGGALRVHVLADEAPVEGAEVTIASEEQPGARRVFRTPKDGTQEMAGIPVGPYAVHVRHRGFVPADAHAVIEAAKTVETFFRLKKGAEILGMVADEQGRPVERTTVALLEPKTKSFALQALNVRTDAEGRYLISGVPPGEYLLEFKRVGYRPMTKEGVMIRDPADRLTIDIILRRGTTLSGRIVDEESRPIAGAWVLALNEDCSDTRTGPDGRFVLRGLGESTLTLRAEAQGYGIVMSKFPAGTTDLEMKLPRAASISGRVDASPLPEAFAFKLWKFEPDAGRELGLQYTARVTGNGEFVVPNLSPGRYRLEIEAPGFEAVDQPSLTLQAGQEISQVVIRMRRKP